MAARASLTAHVKITSRIPQVIAEITANAKQAVMDSALDVQSLASQLAPVDTGALRNSIYVNDGTNSDYATRVATASGLNPDMQAQPVVDPQFVIMLSGSNVGYVVVVGAAAHYGIFQELGTVFQPPQSFMLPAVYNTAGPFQQRMSHIADNV